MTRYLKIREYARQMRRHSTEAENFLWQKVRNRQLDGLKILRQHIIPFPLDALSTKFYIADFYCDELKLIIELDGKIHDQLFEHDLIRTEHMEERGYKVIRFKNEDILFRWSEACDTIRRFKDSPPSPLSTKN